MEERSGGLRKTRSTEKMHVIFYHILCSILRIDEEELDEMKRNETK